uniref:Dystonin n=1 Tax=Anser cygnoides TaxID=8845 RepID=A0A8B9EQC7_ANSCY
MSRQKHLYAIILIGYFRAFTNERDKVQKKTFTKWINQHLMKVRKHVNDLYEDLRDGHNLISLLEVLSGDTLPREKGRMRFHRLQNVQIALDYLKKRQVKLVNIRNDDITDGNPKLTLGLIWTIILHFQISDIHVTGESEDMSAKERLLLWSQQTTEGYAGIRCENFTTCWRDGRLFNAIIHKYRPDLIDMNTVAVQSNLANLEHAFFVAEKLGVARLLDPEDVDVSSPDEKSVITYVSSLYDAFPKVPEGGEGIGANDVEVKWVEYQNMVNYLMQWIRHHVTIMSDRTFPNNPVELKALYNQYLQFKETEIPPKEIDKSKIKRLYKLLEVKFGRIKLPQGYHPNDIEKEWGKLIIAMLEREKTLRPEVERYASEHLTGLVSYSLFLFGLAAGLNGFLLFIQDTKRLESGLQFQHEAEIAGYLLESENLLRQQVIDAQILIDGKYYQADQLVGTLQTLKLMQIRKPLMKSAFVDQNLTEEEVNMKFVQDLLNWVEEMQVQLDRAEWGSDLPSVESHLENHKNVHKAIEEFESSLKEAKMSEIQMTAPLKLSYAEKLHKLESQYSKLLNTSRNQERHLDTLHNFVSRATRELIWLNEKEEEEVAYDWSERNPNITRKKEYHAELMRELDQKEEVIKSVQEIAEQLLLENHPARLTIEAYRAAMQTQWSWILQLCHCVEQHLRENAAYFEFFSDAKEAMEYLKNLKDAIYRKYSCDRTSSLHRLEDLVQESMEEKEQLLQYKSTVAGLVGRAKAIIQLKPRNPDCILKTSIPIKAICDYRQIEITIYKDDECVLANNSHRAKWKVISPSGNEAMVPSVCFTVPPPNKEAIDTANRIEQQFQNVLALWHESHVNMKSVVSWHYLTNEIEAVRAGNVIKTMLPGEHQQVLSNLQSRFDDFVEDSQESKIFTSSDTAQLEREVNICKQYYQELLKSAEREEQEESIYNLYISEVRNIRLRLESCEERLIRQIRTPMERDDLHESVFRISEQEVSLWERLFYLDQAAGSPSVPTLRSELNIVIQNMNQVYSMSSIYIDKLKTVNLVLKNTQGAESLVKLYETKLCEEEAVTADKNNIENLMGTLKKREVFHALEDELQKAKMISDQMFKMHKERDLDFDWHKEKVDQLAERWQNIHSQIENRLRDLESINKSLKYYKDTYNSLDTWIQQVEDTQRKIQEIHPENSKALAKQLNQHKMLVSEIEMKQSKIDECQKYAEQYSAAVKDYELQTMTYRAMVDSQQKSPVKRRRMQSSSDFIIQEFMDLRTRYTALVTLMTQYIKFAGDSLKRLEEEEVGHLIKDNRTKRTAKKEEASVREAYSDLMAQQNSTTDENRKLMGKVKALEEMLEDMKKQKFQVEQELPKLREAAENERKKQQKDMEEICLQKTKAEQEAKQCRVDLESIEKEKADAKQELECVRQLVFQAETQRSILEENLRAFRNQIEESTFTRRNLEEHLRRKDTNLHDLEQQKKSLMQELKKKTEGEEKLMKLIKQMEQDLECKGNLSEIKLKEKEKTEARRKVVEGRYSVTRETSLPIYTAGQSSQCKTDSEITSFQKKQEAKIVEELKQKVDELNLANKKADKTIKDLKYELNEIELQKSSTEEKSRLLKEKLDEVNSELKCLKIKLEEKDQVEQGYLQQLKELDKQLHRTTGKAEEVMQEAIDLRKIKMNYQEELKSVHQEKAHLKREVEELTRSQAKTEITIKHLNSQISSLQKEKLAAEHRTQSCKGEASNLQDKYKKIQEELLQKTKVEKEYHQEIQMLKNELAKSNQVSETLKRKIEDLNKWNTETKLLMKQIQSESEKMTLEKQSIQRKNEALKTLADGFKEQLRTTNEQLHKQTIMEQEFLCKIKSLEDDLAKTKDLASEYKQKCDKQSASTLTIDLEIKNLNAQMCALTTEKKVSEQKIQLQEVHIQELSSKLKKLQDELHQKTLDEQMARKKMILFQEESIKFKHSAEEFRKKVEKLLESHSNTEKDISGIKLECVALQQEKHMAEENIMLYKIQIEDLQERLKKCHEQLQQGKHAEMDYHQKCRKLEEELEVQKRLVEGLKQKMDLQVKESEHRFLLFQNEVQQNNKFKDCGFNLSCERRGNYLNDTSAREFEQLLPHAKPHSPLFRQKQERSGFTTGQIEENTLYVSGYKTSEGFRREDFAKMNSFLGEEILRTADDTQLEYFTEEYDDIKFQGLRHDVTARQLAEVKLLDRLTIEELRSGQKTINEVQKSLEKFLTKPTAIAGLYLESSKEILSFALAVKKRIIGKALALAFLEAQAATGFIIDPTTGQKFSVDDSVVRELADNEFKSRLHEAEKAVLGYCCSGKVLSVYQAMEARLVERQKGKNILEAQIASGGVIDPIRGVRVPPETAVQLGLLSNTILKFLHEPSSNAKCFHNPNNRKAMYYCDLLKMSLFSVGSKCFLLPVGERKISSPSAEKSHKISVVDIKTGFNIEETLNQGRIDRAVVNKYKEGLITINEFGDILLTSSQPNKDLKSPIAGFWLSETNERIPVLKLIDDGCAKQIQQCELIFTGIIHPVRNTVMSAVEAMSVNALDKEMGMRCLEYQYLTGGLIDPKSHSRLTMEDAIKSGVIDAVTATKMKDEKMYVKVITCPKTKKKLTYKEALERAVFDCHTGLRLLEELNNAKKLISESSLSNLPVVSALEQGLISEPLAIKILENQLSSGHLILPSTGEHLTLQSAFQRNLISPTLYAKLLEKDTCKDLIDPNCAEKISLEQMVHRSIIHEETGLRLLPVKPQEKGRITFKCGRKITILRAAHEGLIDRETMFRLLGAQMMSGGIIDPDSGKRLTVEEAMRQGMIDQDTACGILTHQVQAGGILCPNSGQRLTVDEAVQCNLISSTSALLVLEAQRGFVGLIWPHTGEIFPISTSLHQEMITNELAFKILNDRQKIAALYIPETCEVLGLDQAAQSGLIDINTVSVLNSVILPDKMPSVEELESPCKNAAKWLSTYELLPSVFHDCEEEHEDSGTQDPVCRNTDQAKKLFISYLMVNSYMDANTGRRLLLYDGQLQEAISMLLEGGSSTYNIDENEFSNKYISPIGINQKSADNVHFSNVAGNVQGDLSGVESTSNDRKLIQFDDLGNDKCLQGKDLYVCRSGVCNTSGTEQSEYAQEMLLTKPPELRNVESSTQNSTDRNVLKGLLEDSEWTQVELCKHNDQKANSGNIEGFLLNDSNPNLISETGKEDILLADSLCKENINDKTLQKSSSVNDLSDNKIWRGMERCMEYEPHTLEADSYGMVLDNGKKDDFQRSFGSSVSADNEYRLREESGSGCGHTLQFDDNGYSEQPLQGYTDVRNRASLEDYPYRHGRLSLEGCTDLPRKLCLEDGRDIQWTPLLESNTVAHDGPSVGDSNSTAQSLAVEESDLQFERLLLGDSSSDSSLEGGDSIPQFESNHLEHEYGEVASEEDSSLFDDDDDDAYETPQVDDDDSDVYGSPQIDDDESYDTPQGDDDFDTLQLGDVDTPEPENVPLGTEEGGGLIALREENSSFQELPTSAGESVHYLRDVNLIGLPDSINTASASAETLETVPEEERERTGGFGEKQKLPVTPESEGTKEGCLTSLLNLYETKVQRDRNEEDEMKAESTSSEDESEGTQEEEDYDYDCIDYDSYDDSDTDSDSDEEMDTFYSHHQCKNKDEQLLISVGDIENSDKNNQGIDDFCYSLGHQMGYSLQFQSNHGNSKLSLGKCETSSDVYEERCAGVTCTSKEERQQKTENEYGICVESKHMSQDTTEHIQSENTFDTKWMSCKSEESKRTQILDDTVTSDINVTPFLITKQPNGDDESTQMNMLLSECFTDSMNKNNNTMPILHSSHGQRQKEAVFAEKKILNDMAGMEQLKASSSQKDSKFLTDVPYPSDDSSLHDWVDPITNRKHDQIGKGFEFHAENKDRVNIIKECDITELSKSPIHMESLGEIFDASASKADRETPLSSKEKVNIGQILPDIGETVVCQSIDIIHKDFSENRSSSDNELTLTKAGALGSTEDAKESGDGIVVLPSGNHAHTTDASSAVLSSIGADLNNGDQKEYEGLKNTKGEEFLASETSSFENSFKKQMPMESLQTEIGPCKDFQVKKGFSQSPEMSDTLMEDLKNILQRKLKVGHIYCKEEGEPLSYSDTKTLMQNLLAMVRSTQPGSSMSCESNLSQTSSTARTALMVTAPCTEPKDSDALSLLWPDCRSPDLLRDILKQESCKQKMDDPNEMKSEIDQEVKGPVAKLRTSEITEIFQMSSGDECTSKLEELISGLLTSSQVAGITTGHECKGKVDGLCTLFSTEQPEFGSEIPKEKTLADDIAVAWKSDQEYEKTDSLSKGVTEPAYKSKEAVVDDNLTSMVSNSSWCVLCFLC